MILPVTSFVFMREMGSKLNYTIIVEVMLYVNGVYGYFLHMYVLLFCFAFRVSIVMVTEHTVQGQ